MPDATYEAVDFSCLPNWGDSAGLDEALAAFADCRPALSELADGRLSESLPVILEGLCERACEALSAGTVGHSALAFLEQNFQPHRVVHGSRQGLLTGYFEPVLQASRTKSSKFSVPLYRRPNDLVDADSIDQALRNDHQLTHGRMVGGKLKPYPVRSEIDDGCLDGQNLELGYVTDPVDAFFLHVQGAGILEFSPAERLRIGYDGKNGHPYTSLGQLVIDQGEISREDMSLDRLGDWLRADSARGKQTMQANKSFVFFKELGPADEVRSTGIYDIPLTAGSSLAVDPSYHQIGLPIFVSSTDLKHAPWCPGGFHRLMIAQDVGSAIVGPERGDIYFGSGDLAGAAAGRTACPGSYFVLLPRGFCAE